MLLSQRAIRQRHSMVLPFKIMLGQSPGMKQVRCLPACLDFLINHRCFQLIHVDSGFRGRGVNRRDVDVEPLCRQREHTMLRSSCNWVRLMVVFFLVRTVAWSSIIGFGCEGLYVLDTCPFFWESSTTSMTDASENPHAQCLYTASLPILSSVW